MSDPFDITSAEDLKERLCCVLEEGCYCIAVSLSLPHLGLQYVPIHRLDEGPGNYVFPKSKDLVVNHVLSDHSFLPLAYIHNNLRGTVLTREILASWSFLPTLLSKFGLLQTVNDIKIDNVIRHGPDGSYDPSSFTLQYYLQCERKRFVATRGSNAVLPPPLDMVSADTDIKSIVKEIFSNEMIAKLFDEVCDDDVQDGKHNSNNDPKTHKTTTKSHPIVLPETAFGLKSLTLSKIKFKDGNVRDSSGNYAKKCCYICRGWYTNPPSTSFECSTCGMPICNPDTTGVREGRQDSCLTEH
jgi:hypothetical protein